MLKVSSIINTNIDEPEEDGNLNEFKGLYYNDSHEQKYYEGGAHFKFMDLCGRLEKVVTTLTPDRKGRSMYEDWGEIKMNILSQGNTSSQDIYSSLAKTKENSHKYASDSSKEFLLEINSTSKLKEMSQKGAKSGTSGASIVSNSTLNQNHAQSRNNSVNYNITNVMNTKNLINKEREYSVGSNLKGVSNLNIIKTYNNLHYNKSNSLSFNLNHLSNMQNSNNLNKLENLNNLSGININVKKEDNNNTSHGYNCNNNFNNMSYLYKKVQPKIIKNISSKLNSIQFGHNYSNIQNNISSTNYNNISNNNFNKKNEAMSRNHPNNDLLRVGNNTKNNLTYVTRSKILNSSGLNNSNINREIQTQSQSNLGISNFKQINNLNLKMKLSKKLSNNLSKNYNKNEISTLSDLTSSINRGNSKDSTKRNKITNVIVKPKINISFVNNINNLMASLESINNTFQNNYQNNHDSSTINNNNNKKSRNEKTDSFMNSDNSNTTNLPHIQIKNQKLNNYKTMVTNNLEHKSRNIKTLYSGNLDSFSKNNTYEHDGSLMNRDRTGNTVDSIRNIKNIASEKKKHSRNPNNISMVMPEYTVKTINTLINYNIPKRNENFKMNSTINKNKEGKDNSTSNNYSAATSNYLNLKQKISNLKLGIGKLKPNVVKSGVSNYINNGISGINVSIGNNGNNSKNIGSNMSKINNDQNKPNKFLILNKPKAK